MFFHSLWRYRYLNCVTFFSDKNTIFLQGRSIYEDFGQLLLFWTFIYTLYNSVLYITLHSTLFLHRWVLMRSLQQYLFSLCYNYTLLTHLTTRIFLSSLSFNHGIWHGCGFFLRFLIFILIDTSFILEISQTLLFQILFQLHGIFFHSFIQIYMCHFLWNCSRSLEMPILFSLLVFFTF